MPFPMLLFRTIFATLLIMIGAAAIAQTPTVASLAQQLGRAET